MDVGLRKHSPAFCNSASNHPRLQKKCLNVVSRGFHTAALPVGQYTSSVSASSERQRGDTFMHKRLGFPAVIFLGVPQPSVEGIATSAKNGK